MKKNFNQYTKGDLPLDSSSPSKTSSSNIKPKISQIKATGKTKSANITKIERRAADKENLNKKMNDMSANELDNLSEKSVRKAGFRTKRNRVIIIILVILLLMSGGGIVAYSAFIRIKNNCFMHSSGGDVTFIVDRIEQDEFRCPADIKGNRILQLAVDIKIKSAGIYKVKYHVVCKQNDSVMHNTMIYEPERNDDYQFFADGSGNYNLQGTLEVPYGGRTIKLCKGVILDREYENTLNANNFQLDFYVELERI